MKGLQPIVVADDFEDKEAELKEIRSEVRKYEDVVVYTCGQVEFLYCLFKDPPAPTDLDLWAKCLTVLSTHFQVFLSFMFIMFSFEIGCTPDSFRTGGSIEKTKTFLRQTTLLSKALDSFSQTRSKPFIISVTGPIVKFFLTEYQGDPIELDETRATPEQVESSGDTLIHALDLFLDSFENAIDTAPHHLRALCQQIVTLGVRANGDTTFMVSSFLMLRCLTPSLVVPDRYGLLEALGIESDGADGVGMSGCRAFSRILQKFVNKTYFEESNAAYVKINQKFVKEKERLKSMLLGFSSPPAQPRVPGSPRTPLPPPPSIEHLNSVLSSCHLLHMELHHVSSGLYKHIGHLSPLCDAHDIPQRLLSLLPPPPPKLTFSLTPKQVFAHTLRQDPDPDSEELQEHYISILQEAHRPLGEAAERLNTISRTRFLNVCGMNRERTAVVQLVVERMPTNPALYQDMLLYFVMLMDGIARLPYVITIITDPHLGASAARPAYSWLRRIYETDLTRKYVKNLKAVYFLYPSVWVRGMLGFLNPIGGRHGSVKIKHVQSLPTLIEELKIDTKRFPAPAQVIKSCGGVLTLPQIGIRIQDIMRRADQQDRDYPTLPFQCIRWIRAHGLSSSGAFDGLDGNEVEEVGMGQLDLPDVGLLGVGWLLLNFMKNIPNGGVFGPQVMELCSAGADLCLPADATPLKEPATVRVSKALHRLPPEHLSLASDFFLLLHEIFIHSADTGLSASSLADITVSYVFPPPVSYSKTPPQPTQGEITLTKFLIAQPMEFWDSVWCSDESG
eukprot:TRINITY_DN8461_c0_g1_i1.p1 TRINITY_DN8461_c0_g1~~TRINITY_DN8461_c0_g1_i1.p1  ORF type:complete len:788 (+),score=103.49 TRINITY_DN8461_c0_g1_i1:70-2433(+)